MLDKATPFETTWFYVASNDGGDHAPADMKGQIITSQQQLSIYQAWNHALSTVRTRFVMNLNLDVWLRSI